MGYGGSGPRGDNPVCDENLTLTTTEYGNTEKGKRTEAYGISGTSFQFCTQVASQGSVKDRVPEELGGEHEAGARRADQSDRTFKDPGKWTTQTKDKAQQVAW